MSTRARFLKRGQSFEDCKARGVQLARELSALLRGAGFERSEQGGARAHSTRGFACREVGNGTRPEPTASVSHHLGHGSWDHEACAKACAPYRAAIEATGRYRVESYGRDGAFTVTRAIGGAR